MELIIALPIILAYLFLTLFATAWAYRWAKRRGYGGGARITAVLGALLLAYAIPFGDHTVGYVYFSRLCATEAGTKIYRTVRDVGGFWWSPISSGAMALQYGYAFVEGGSDPEKVRRYEVKDGAVIEYKNVRSISEYAVDPVALTGPEKTQFFVRYRRVIAEKATGEKLAEHISFHYRGGWLIRALLAGYGGSAAQCHIGIDPEKLITAVLEPVRERK
jgi:hypothetical protein